MKTARVVSDGGGGGVNATERKWNCSKQEMGVKKEGVVLTVACHLNRVERIMALKLNAMAWEKRTHAPLKWKRMNFAVSVSEPGGGSIV